MTPWLTAILPVFFAALVLTLPGYVVGRIVSLRGLFAWAFAGPLSLALLASASLILPLVGVPWSVVGVIGVTAAAILIVVLLRVACRRWFTPIARPSSAGGWVLVALGTAGALIVAQLGLIVVAPENISQAYDNIFHLNVARFML